MDYILDLATQSDLSAVCHLIDERIRWMDAVGIRQWNVTDYWGVYPRSHYEELVRLGQLYVLRQRPHGKIAGAAALYETDPRWQGLLEIPAYYVHHFAADEAQKGAGAVLLSLIEELGARRGKAAIRLDCAVDSPKLNAYYEEKGYVYAGQCVDGVYEGNLREKKLK